MPIQTRCWITQTTLSKVNNCGKLKAPSFSLTCLCLSIKGTWLSISLRTRWRTNPIHLLVRQAALTVHSRWKVKLPVIWFALSIHAGWFDTNKISKFLLLGFVGPATAQELIRRSMPNLNNQTRMRLPQPSGLAGNLNRQHGSESGLRPPSSGVGIRPPICSAVNGSSLIRPQFKVPQPPPQVQPAVNNSRVQAATTSDPVRPSQLVGYWFE